MTEKSSTGHLGEKIAEQYLLSKGYEIIQRNWHSMYGEIDIIAQKNRKIHFVEVKTRKSLTFGSPVESYNYFKQRKIIKTAFLYMDQIKTGQSFQLDFIGIMLNADNSTKEIEMIENAINES